MGVQGSTDVLLDEKGGVVERRSYDAFGAQRSAVWGGNQSIAPSLVSMGYTGQEGDESLGLVNMQGRIYDPTLARFMTTDPIVHDPHDTQAWNRFSYVRNSPLNLVDPTGFDDDPPASTPRPPERPKTAPNTIFLPPVYIYGDLPKVVKAPATSDRNTLPNSGQGQNGAAKDDAKSPGKPLGADSVFVVQNWRVSDANLHVSDKFNPYTPPGQVGQDVFGSPPPYRDICEAHPGGCGAIVGAAVSLVPGLNSATVFARPGATTKDKVVAVTTDLLAAFWVDDHRRGRAASSRSSRHGRHDDPLPGGVRC